MIILLCRENSRAQIMISSVDSTSLYTYDWHLFKLSGVNMMKTHRPLDAQLMFFPGETGTFSGTAFCSDLEGMIKQKDDSNLQFLSIKEDTCDWEGPEYDRRFVDMLRQVDHYKIKKNELRLFGNGVLLARFYPAYTESGFYSMLALEGSWTLNSLARPNGNMDIKLKDPFPKITFAKDSVVGITGYTGCNYFSNKFTLSPGKIRFHETEIKKESICMDGVEEAFLINIPLISWYSVNEDVLYFWVDHHAAMIFDREKDIRLRKGAAWRFLDKLRRNTVFVCGNE
jgi:heat shock protein HslJ